MLRVASSARPDCDKLLDIIKKYRNNKKSFQNTQDGSTGGVNLLNTIKVPKNLRNFDNKLPQANYIQTAPDLQDVGNGEGNDRMMNVQENGPHPDNYNQY